MNNKLSLILNDPELIAEIAKDPEVQIRIKDAIIDGIGKRAVKLLNANAEIASVTSSIGQAISKQIKEQITNGESWRPTLKTEYKKIIEETLKDYVKTAALEISKEYYKKKKKRALESINAWKSQMELELERNNIESIIRDQVNKYMNAKFK